MFAESELSRPSTSKAFAAFQTCLPTNIRLVPALSLVGRRRKCLVLLRSRRTREALASSCLKSNQPDHENISPKHQLDHDRDGTLLETSEFGFILTSVVTAAAGGPALSIWGLFFLVLGKYTGAPTWLQAISACIFAGLTDALSYNWTNFSFDSGVTPFFVYFLGCGATLLYEFASSSLRTEKYGQLSDTNPPNQGSKESGDHNHDVRPDMSTRENQLAEWDQAFNESGGKTDGNAK